MDVDYEAYAAGEAELGWLNASLILRCGEPLNLDAWLLEFAESLRGRLQAAGLETAHIKVLGTGEGRSGVVNLISNDLPAELSRPSAVAARSVHLTINARVAGDPQQLLAIVCRGIEDLAPGAASKPPISNCKVFGPDAPRPNRPWQCWATCRVSSSFAKTHHGLPFDSRFGASSQSSTTPYGLSNGSKIGWLRRLDDVRMSVRM